MTTTAVLSNYRCSSGRAIPDIGIRDENRCGELLVCVRGPDDKHPMYVCPKCDGGVAKLARRNA